MVSRNDITGDAIQTRGASKQYESNYDAIFGKKSKAPDAPAALTDEELALKFGDTCYQGQDYCFTREQIQQLIAHVRSEAQK